MKRLLLVAAMIAGLLTGSATVAVAAPTITIAATTSAWFGYDASPTMDGIEYPTVSVEVTLSEQLPEYRYWAVRLNQRGVNVQQVFSGSHGAGLFEFCVPDCPVGEQSLGAMFGGISGWRDLRPGKATVTVLVSDINDVVLLSATRQVTVPRDGYRELVKGLR